MNRFILACVIIGCAVIALGIGAFVLVFYFAAHQSGQPPIGKLKGKALSLGQLEQVLKDLQQHENDPDQLTKVQEKLAPEIPNVVACFEIDDEDLRVNAAEVLGKLGPRAVEPLRPALKHQNPKVRFWAVQSLGFLKAAAAGASDDLIECLKDNDVDVRYKAVYALGPTGVKTDKVVEGLILALGDADESVSTTASETLETFGAPSKDALPMLVELANNGANPAAKATALKLLGRLGEPALPAFKALLVKSNPLDRLTIVHAVADLGPKAKPILPELETIMVKNRFWDDQRLPNEPDAYLVVFMRCGADGAQGLTNVLKVLHDPKSPDFAPNDPRSDALLKSLGELGALSKPVVPLLIDLLKEREELRLKILDTLGDIGPAAKEAAPSVEALTREPATVLAAKVCLRRMGVVGKN